MLLFLRSNPNSEESCIYYTPIYKLSLSTRKFFGSITRQLSNHFDTLKVEIPCRHYFIFYDVLVFVFFSSPLMGNKEKEAFGMWNCTIYYVHAIVQ